MTHYYVYKITCTSTKEFYIGCRTSKKPPAQDGSYMGAGVWAKKQASFKREKEILKIFDCLKEARAFELITIRKYIRHKKCMNVSGKSLANFLRQKKEVKRKELYEDIRKHNRWRMNKEYFCTNTKWINETYPNQYRLDDQGVYIFIGNSR